MNPRPAHLTGDAGARARAAALLLAHGTLHVIAFAVALVATGAIVAFAGAILIPDAWPHIEGMAYNLAGVPTEARSPASPDSLRALRADLLTSAIWLAAGAAALYVLLLLACESLRPLLQGADDRARHPELPS